MSFKNKENKELSDLFQELKIENGVLQGIYKITVLFYVGTALTIVLIVVFVYENIIKKIRKKNKKLSEKGKKTIASPNSNNDHIIEVTDITSEFENIEAEITYLKFLYLQGLAEYIYNAACEPQAANDYPLAPPG